MVCADTNCLTAYLAGDQASDIEFLDQLLKLRTLVLPPVVVAELLSSPELPRDAELLITAIPRLRLDEGYWERSGKLRARLASAGYAARLADTLIAQSCLDNNATLMTRDKGFRRFAKVAGLRLLL